MAHSGGFRCQDQARTSIRLPGASQLRCAEAHLFQLLVSYSSTQASPSCAVAKCICITWFRLMNDAVAVVEASFCAALQVLSAGTDLLYAPCSDGALGAVAVSMARVGIGWCVTLQPGVAVRNLTGQALDLHFTGAASRVLKAICSCKRNRLPSISVVF